MSDSQGLVDFAILLVFFVLTAVTCPVGKRCFWGNSNYRRIVLGLVEMTCGLVHAIYSLPKWQAVKLTFFAPCNNTKHAAVDKPGSDQIGSALKLISELLSFNELHGLIRSDPIQVLLMPQTDMSN